MERIRILAHRGYWNENISRNSFEAVRAALEKNFGFESDVRDYSGRLVVSHDIPNKESLDAEKIFGLLHEFRDAFTFAINIKADGLKNLLGKFLRDYEISNYFLFDMSVPQMIEFHEAGLRFFTRQSEFEKIPVMLDEAAGVWLDGFRGTDWITENLLRGYLDAGKEISLVSPELHGRMNYKNFWERIKNFVLDSESENIFLCTDRPDEARCFFSEQN